MSDTPRTDAALCRHHRFGGILNLVPFGNIVRADFARELERENAKLREDKARLDWLKAEPYVRLQQVREWLPISFVPPAPDNTRAAFDNAMKHDPNYRP